LNGVVVLDKGFIGSLFDFSFDHYVTPKIISIVYAILMIIMGFSTVTYAFSGFAESTTYGLVTLITSPIVFFLGLIAVRIYCEIVVALIKIAQNTRGLRAGNGSSEPQP
jgi:hypothetical protein